MPSKTYAFAKSICLAVFLLFSLGLFAQKTVTGRVTNNSDGLGLPSATVQLKGTKYGTQTKTDGTFSIDIPAGSTSNTLVISLVGYYNIEIPVSGRSTVGTIGMTFNTRDLNEVVVTGYTAQKKKDITGAVAVVD